MNAPQPPALPNAVAPPRWRRRLALLAIVLLSLVLRGAYFTELNRGPCVWLHLWDQSDMSLFHAWARLIAEGDWLTNRSLHPYHAWHEVIARQALDSPDVTPQQGRALWERWYGGKCFHQEPLYAYFVAAIYWLIGPDPRCVFVVQMLLGVANNLMVYLIARRYFGDLAAELAALLAVFCGPLLYYEMILIRTTLTVSATLVLILLVDVAARRGTWGYWLLAGVVTGMATLLRVTFFLYALGVFAAAIAVSRRCPSRWALRTGALVGGIALGGAPLVARNLAVGVGPFQLNSVGAVTFLMGNTEDYAPMEGAVFSEKYVARIMEESDGRFRPAVVGALRTHPSVFSYVWLLGRKFAAVWHWYEQPNNTNFYYFRLDASALRLSCVGFGVVAPIAIVGLAIALRRVGSSWPLYLMVLGHTGAMVAVYVLSRFRAPLLAALIPLAGFALARVVDWCRRVRLGPAILALGAAAGLWACIARPLPEHIPLIRNLDYMVPVSVYYLPEAAAAHEAGDLGRAARLYREALNRLPPAAQEMGRIRPAQSEEEADVATSAARLHRLYAETLRDLRQPQTADAQERRASELEAAAQP